MQFRITSLSAVAGLALSLCALAGCSSSHNDRVAVDDNPPPVTNPPPVEPNPTEPVVVENAGPLKAADIMRALSEKSFTYAAGPRAGTISYYGDGTFNYNEKGKGEGSGVWQASDGKLCQALNPTSFLPKGTRSECQPFGAKGGGYVAGSMRLTPT